MAVLASDVITLARVNLSDSVVQGRFSDTSMLLWASTVVNRMTRRILFPESRLTFSTVAYQQEYPLPELFRTLRVYLAGQLLVPTTLQVLEGHQIQLYDMSGTSGAPAQSGGGPTGNAGTASPQWTLQTATNYPVLQEFGAPAPDAVPWFAGSRPRYYYRGGSIGFVPMPLGVVTANIDCVAGPSAVTSDSQQLLIPPSWVEAAAKGVEALALGSDRELAGSPSAKIARDDSDALVKELIATKKRFTGDSPRGPKMLTQRSFYTHNARRSNRGGY